MADNPLRYSDLFGADLQRGIDELIDKLSKLRSSYSDMASDMRRQAESIRSSLSMSSGATSSGRDGISQAGAQTDALLAKYKALETEVKRLSEQLETLSKAQSQLSGAQRSAARITGEEQATYAGLNKVVEDHLGSLAKNSARLAAVRQEMAALNVQIKNAQSGMGSEGSTVGELTQKYRELSVEKRNLNRVIDSQIKGIQAEEGSYNALNQELVRINMTLRSMGSWDTGDAQALLTRSQELQRTLSDMDARLGNYHRNVGNYASAWSGVGFATQQVVRELPSLAISLNTFFVAISNNIPILVDEINMMRRANEELRAQGKPTQSVIRQIISAIASWQSLLVVGISLLSVYGQDILRWAQNFFRSKEAIDAATQSARDLAAVTKSAGENSSQEMTRLRFLYAATQDTTRSMRERIAAVNELQSKYPSYLGNFSDEEILAGKAAEAYMRLTNSIRESARARAAMDRMVGIEKENLQLETNNLADTNWINRNMGNIRQSIVGSFNAGLRAPAVNPLGAQAIADENRKLQQALEAVDAGDMDALYGALVGAAGRISGAAEEFVRRYEKMQSDRGRMQMNERRLSSLSRRINVDDLINSPSEDGREGRSGRQGRRGRTSAQREEQDDSLELLRRYQDEWLKLEEDSLSKRRLQVEYEYGRQIEDLKNRLQEEKDLTEEEQRLINGTVIALTEQRRKALIDVNREWDERERERERKQLEALRATYDDNTQEALGIDKQLNENARKGALAANAALPENERVPEDVINRKYDLSSHNIDERLADMMLERLDQERELAEAELKLVNDSEDAKTKLRLEWEKKRIQLMLAQNGAGIRDLTETQKKTLLVQMEGINKDLEKYEHKYGAGGINNLFDLIGIPKDYQKGLNILQENIMNSLGEIVQARLEAANEAIRQAERETEAAREAYENEKEAKAAGYANNVALARKEFEDAKKNEEKALKEREKAQKMQLALDTVTQTNSLITASAELWKSFAGLGPAGPALAVAAIATMWASFMASKAMAFKLVHKQNTKGDDTTYGEGGVELLTGGSHASGHDIDLGRTKRGRRRAEGGEILAIFNKKASRRYPQQIKRMVDAVNKGTIDYAGALDFPQVMNAYADLGGVEKRLDKLIEQGKKSRYIDEKGNLVEVKGNYRRTYKHI